MWLNSLQDDFFVVTRLSTKTCTMYSCMNSLHGDLIIGVRYCLALKNMRYNYLKPQYTGGYGCYKVRVPVSSF